MYMYLHVHIHTFALYATYLQNNRETKAWHPYWTHFSNFGSDILIYCLSPSKIASAAPRCNKELRNRSKETNSR